MTSVFCLLLVLCSTSHLLLPKCEDKFHLLELIPSLQRIIPKFIVMSSIWYGWIHFKTNSFENVQETIHTQYLWKFDKLCNTIDQLQTIRSLLGSFVGNANVHRLVELIYHTIRTFGHVRVFHKSHSKRFTRHWSIIWPDICTLVIVILVSTISY